MTLQILISTMNQQDESLLQRMNVNCDVIVINQCNYFEYKTFLYKSHKVVWISCSEKGVGLSRNTALMRATADIVLFSDDDIVFEDDIEAKILREYELHNKAELITFNFKSLNVNRPEPFDKTFHKIRWFNSLKYGAFRISIKTVATTKNNLSFSLLFGGGAKFQAGEDNMFMTQALSKRIKCYASNICLGTVEQKESTWFKGYDDCYFIDRGALFYAMYGWKAYFLLWLLEIKNLNKMNKNTTIKCKNRIKLEYQGMKLFKKYGK